MPTGKTQKKQDGLPKVRTAYLIVARNVGIDLLRSATAGMWLKTIPRVIGKHGEL